MSKTEIKNKIKEYLFNRPEVSFAYIFGSFVRQDHYHDIDVALFLSPGFNKNDLNDFPYGYESSLIGELTFLLKKNIDLIVINNAEILIQHRIINNGFYFSVKINECLYSMKTIFGSFI